MFDAVAGLLARHHTSRRPAVAVSGGADSLCLALLTRDWCGPGGDPLALIVDHGLRPDSAEEARITETRLAGCGIESRILTLRGLSVGPGLAARARAARYAALFDATRQSGRIDLLLGHHRADQAETLAMRRLARSGDSGLAAMAAIRETRDVRLLRPLLGIAPGALRAMLRHRRLGWIEDPSNRNPATLRARLRADLADPDGDGPATVALAGAAGAYGRARAGADRRVADELAARAALFPEAYAVLSPGPVSEAALASLIRTLGGAWYAPARRAIARIAANQRPCVLGGVRIQPAGRLGPGLLLTREPAAMAPPMPARKGAVWDGRFIVEAASDDGAAGGGEAEIGAVGAEAPCLRRHTLLPDAVLRTLPALRVNGVLVEVPHIGYHAHGAAHDGPARLAVRFAPDSPASGAPFGV